MRKIISTIAFLLAVLLGFSQAGSLDKSFNGTGTVQTAVNTVRGANANVVAIQPADQKILVAGSAISPDGYTSFSVVRYLPNGTLDATFGTGGIAIVSVGEDTYGAQGIAVQTDGKILLVGNFTLSVGDNEYGFGVILRLTKTGTLDPAFGAGGEKTVTGLSASAVVLQSNGEIIVGGSYKTYIGIMRFSTTGTQDMQWGGNGVSTFNADPGGYSDLQAITIQPNGRVVVVGYTSNGSYNMMVGRLTTNGSADPSFGTGGKMFFTVGSDDELLNGAGVGIQSNGKIVLNGSYFSASGPIPMLVVRLNTDGTLDNSFAGNGKKGIVIGDLCYAGGLAIQSDDKIISVGSAGPQFGPLTFVIVRLNAADGSLDASFGQGGMVNTVLSGAGCYASGVAIQANGRIVVTGDAIVLNGTTDYAVYATARYLATGTAGAATTDESTEGHPAGFDLASSASLRIYPNPASSLLRVDGLDPAQTTTLIVTDASGHTVLTARVGKQLSTNLNITNLAAGIYFLEVRTGDKKRTVEFVKTR
jgi:uncharacterized delta-60 repeat protein